MMRIRALGRFVAALAILTAVLCLLPASTKIAVAKPIDWENNSPTPPPPGDNDGVVLKSASLKSSTGVGTKTWGARSTANVTTAGGRYVLGGMRGYDAVMGLHYWLFWVR